MRLEMAVEACNAGHSVTRPAKPWLQRGVQSQTGYSVKRSALAERHPGPHDSLRLHGRARSQREDPRAETRFDASSALGDLCRWIAGRSWCFFASGTTTKTYVLLTHRVEGIRLPRRPHRKLPQASSAAAGTRRRVADRIMGTRDGAKSSLDAPAAHRRNRVDCDSYLYDAGILRLAARLLRLWSLPLSAGSSP